MDAVILCKGTLQVEHPDAVLLDYVDVRNGFAFPSYDRLVTNGSAAPRGDADAPACRGIHFFFPPGLADYARW